MNAFVLINFFLEIFYDSLFFFDESRYFRFVQVFSQMGEVKLIQGW